MIFQAFVRARRSAELCWWAIEERIREVLVETPRGEYPELNTPRQHPESRRHAIAIDNVFSCPIKLSSANTSRDSLRGGRDVRSRSRESKRQDEAIRTERGEVLLTTRRSERVRFRGTALPQPAIAPCCPSTNNPPCRRRLKRRVEKPATTSQAGLKKHAARLNPRGRADSVGRT